MALAIEHDISAEAGDGENACELHYPPYQHLHAEQGESYPRTDHRSDKDDERHVGVEHVGARYVLVVLSHCQPLPYRTQQKDGREDEVDKFVGDKDDAEGYHDESYCHERTIDAIGTLDLTVVET